MLASQGIYTTALNTHVAQKHLEVRDGQHVVIKILFNRMASAIREHRDELARLEMLEHGTVSAHAPLMIDFAVGNMELAASGARTSMGKVLPPVPSMGDTSDTGVNTVVYMKRKPVGMCALITPWNVPSLMIGTKIGSCPLKIHMGTYDGCQA